MPSDSSTRSIKLTANALAGMHPSLVGDGERAAAGLPFRGKSAQAANALTGFVTPGGNALAAGVAPPTPPPPAAVAAPVAVAAQMVPDVPPGQKRSTVVVKVIGADKMQDDALAKQISRFEWVRNALGAALKRPGLTHDDMVQIVADGVRDKAFPASEAGEILSGMTTDPAKLKDEIQ